MIVQPDVKPHYQSATREWQGLNVKFLIIILLNVLLLYHQGTVGDLTGVLRIIVFQLKGFCKTQIGFSSLAVQGIINKKFYVYFHYVRSQKNEKATVNLHWEAAPVPLCRWTPCYEIPVYH